MKDAISKREEMILEFISKQIKERGYPPSVREICTAVNLKSTSTVHMYLENLKKKGLLTKDAFKTRAIRIVNNKMEQQSKLSTEYLEVPIIGRVTAGQPILAVENHEGSFPLPMEFAKNNNLFMLNVSGDSMINAGILSGDFVIVSQQQTASNGEIVVALIDDEATVKTFYKENNHIRLQPQNDSMKPIILSEVTILGKVVGVFRKL